MLPPKDHAEPNHVPPSAAALLAMPEKPSPLELRCRQSVQLTIANGCLLVVDPLRAGDELSAGQACVFAVSCCLLMNVACNLKLTTCGTAATEDADVSRQILVTLLARMSHLLVIKANEAAQPLPSS
jgi:hypothetical protein